jgi:hypothetical protein
MSRESIGRFIEYFSKPLNNEQLIYLNTINKVIPEKIELYNDFIVSLCYLIYDTYLGDDVMSEENEQISHFNWCWNKNIENFEKEHIFINRKGEHYYYYQNYFLEMFYCNQDKSKVLFGKIAEFWVNTFSLIKNKTKSEYDMFIEVYRLMCKYFPKAS